MRHILVLTTLLLAPLAALHAAEATKPNILIILADDMGYADLGVHGCQDIPTPNIDRIGVSGVRFTDAYANGSFCTPTRAALLSCRYQHRISPSTRCIRPCRRSRNTTRASQASPIPNAGSMLPCSAPWMMPSASCSRSSRRRANSIRRSSSSPTTTAARRRDDWKYVHSTEGDATPGPKQKPAQDRLFNLASDLGEQHDLAAEQPAKLAELKKLYEAWSDEVDTDCRKLGLQPKFSKPAKQGATK